MQFLVNFVYLLVAFTALLVNCAESMTPPAPNTNSGACSADAKVSMSQGFITAAMSALSPLGVGSCTDNVCSSVLAPCPNTTCCLSNQSGSSCGCLKKTALGTTICEDPKLLSVDVAGCDPQTGASHEVKVTLYSDNNPETPCNSALTSKLIINEEGQLYLEILTTICNDEQTRKSKLGSNKLTVTSPYAAKNYLYFQVAIGNPGDLKMLHTVLGREQVENVIAHHKSFLHSE